MLRSRSLCCVLCSLIGLTLALLLLFGTPAGVQAQPPKGPVSFINDVAPILKKNCFACHDSKKRKGKLDMTTYERFRTGGTNADPVTPGDPRDSEMIKLLTTKGAKRMPPKEAGDAVPKEKIALISQWIKEGAKLDQGIAPGADLMRELRVRWKPPAPPAAYTFPVNINALAFTPDSKKLVVGGYHELTVWALDTAKLEKRVYTRAERAYGMVFLPDGKLAVAGGRPGQEGDVCIYDLKGGKPKAVDGVTVLDGVNDKGVLIAALLDTDDAVLALALSKDGKKLASGGCDRLVRVWDLTPGPAKAKLEASIENHADWVFGVAFSPDGKHLLTASRDKTAKIWDFATKESMATFPDHQNGVYGVAISQDGKAGISVGEDGNVRFWEATDAGKKIGKQIRTANHGKAVFKIAYHADPKSPLLATCGVDGTVRLWNGLSGAALKTLGGLTDYVYAVALSPDGKLVAAGGYAGEVKVWNTTTGALVKAFNGSPGYVAAKAAPTKK